LHLAETGLMHFRARGYAPRLGRFIQRDPAGFRDGMNLYEIAKGNPIIRTDPFGLGVGHHPFPESLAKVLQMIGAIDDDALDYAFGAYYGSEDPPHRWTELMCGIIS
jgi:RHS repeat-associated protein